MRVIGCQFDIAWEDKHANFAKAQRLVAAASPQPNSLVVLPEMFATGFSMNLELSESSGAETEEFLARTAQEFQICLVAGAPIRGRDGRVRNKALVFSSKGELIAFYAKMNLFTPGGERKHYTAGRQPIVFEWQGWKRPLSYADDLRFPEVFRMAAASHQPELFIVIANWPEMRIHHWLRLLQARAIENQAFVVGVNRCGQDPYHSYNGHSAVVDPDGTILVDGGSHEGCISCDLELAGLMQDPSRLPFLADLQAVRLSAGQQTAKAEP